MTDLVIYDSETNDADVRHGQILQFGALKADMNFNVQAETHFRIRRLPWIVPTPEALRVTRIHLDQLHAPGSISEYAASGEIERFLVPGYGMSRVLMTFNGPKFDDELLRTTFFRSLRNPWFSSGKLTSRVDVLSLVRLAHSVNPNVLSVPLDGEGKRRWKLEYLCEANGIEIKAHDALGDSWATLELAKLVATRAPWAWANALKHGLPSRVESLFADSARTGKPILLFTHFGEEDVVPCLVLGTDSKKKWILLDLRKENFPERSEEISDVLFTRGTPFPVIRSNTSPTLLDVETARRIHPELDMMRIGQRALEIKKSGLGEAAVAALKGIRYEDADDATSEERIYSGFIPDRDKPSMTAFHRADDWNDRAALQFTDPRLKDFAARIMLDAVIHGEADLPADTVSNLEASCAEALARPFAPPGSRWATLASAKAGGADDEWLAWARSAFGEGYPVNIAGCRTEEMPAQMELAF